MSLILIISIIVLSVFVIACLFLADIIGNLVIKVIDFITYKGEDKK